MAKILVVDDAADTREAFQIAFEQAGHSVVTADDGGMAIAKMVSDKPDVVVLDLMLPRINGWEFLDSRARNQDLLETPVVVLSGYTVNAQPIPLAARILSKPVDPSELLEVVEDVLTAKSPESEVDP